jgi:hypothetical protein
MLKTALAFRIEAADTTDRLQASAQPTWPSSQNCVCSEGVQLGLFETGHSREKNFGNYDHLIIYDG